MLKHKDESNNILPTILLLFILWPIGHNSSRPTFYPLTALTPQPSGIELCE